MAGLENAFALVIGIDTGYAPDLRLPPTEDATAMAALLTNPAEGGYQSDRIHLLTNEAATRERIQSALADLSATTDADSTVFIYCSGHGGRIGDEPTAEQYLIPVDVDITSEASLVATAISGDAFTAALDQLPARKVVIVFDMCHSGGIGVLKGVDVPAFRAGLAEAYYERLAAGRGRVILASSRETESSWVLSGDHHSLFTKHLLAGLRGGVAAEDGLVRVFDLFEYLQPRVTAEAPPYQPQHPVFKAHLEENLPIALRLGGQPAATAKDTQGYRYDAYISYVDREPDATWVWDTLVPKLNGEGLRVAVSGDSAEPGVPKLVSQERGIAQAKRTVAVLSDAYLGDHATQFENLVAQTMGVNQGQWRLVPVSFGAFDQNRLPIRIRMLQSLELGDSRRGDRAIQRLVNALNGPVPSMD